MHLGKINLNIDTVCCVCNTYIRYHHCSTRRFIFSSLGVTPTPVTDGVSTSVLIFRYLLQSEDSSFHNYFVFFYLS
jgi:hypothetical protein